MNRRLPALLVAFALALAATSISVGFCTDDYGFRALLRARPHAFVDMFRFASGELAANQLRIATGHLPWWTAPDFRLHLVRPLTGALFAADVALFGQATLGYHLHSLAWYAALLLGAACLFRRLLAPPAAIFALAVFALRGAHVLPYAWISARHLVIGGALATWALVVHLGPGLKRRIGAALLFALALAASEAALGGIAFAFFLTVVAAEDRRGWRLLRGLAPLLVVTVAYLAIYRLVGGGARASGAYHDPIADPAGFLGVALVRVPALLADAVLGVPVLVAARHPVLVALVGALAAALLAVLLATPRVRSLLPPRPSLALAAGGLAGVVLGASGTLGGRVLVVPDLGFAALVGTVLAAAFTGERRGASVRTAGVVLAVAHLAFGPVVSVVAIAELRRIARATEAVAASVRTAIPRGSSPPVFVIAASDPFVFLYPRAVLADRAPGLVECWSVLSAAPADHEVERTGDRTLRIRSLGRPLLTGFDALFRSPTARPFAPGDEVRQCGATFHVEAVDDGRPTRVLVTFASSLDTTPDDDGPLLLAWDGAELRRFVPPAIASAPVEVAWKPGPQRARR
jgi:hypothetical protein